MSLERMDFYMSSFETGSFYITRGIDAEMKKNRRFRKFLVDSIRKYVNKDWGDTPSEDAELNEQALESGDRLLAVYDNSESPNLRIWIITEADRSATTILFPDEY